MSRCRWTLILSESAVVWCLLVLAWSCGGDGGSSPTGPVWADKSGKYVGSFGVENASGCGCVGEGWSQFDFSNSMEWDIWQNSTSVEGSYFIEWDLGWTPKSTRCDFTGTLDRTFSVASASCDVAEVQMICADGTPRDLVLKSLKWEGAVAGDDIYGDWTGTWDCFDPRTDAAAGVLTLDGEWRIIG